MTRAGAQVRLPTRNALLLLARLAVEGPQTREQLAALLWPDAGSERGRTNLRKTLAYVRDAFGRDCEVVTGAGQTLALAGAVVTDLEVVRSGSLDAAVDAWRGDLLAGVQAEGEELDAWLAQQRVNWSERLTLAAERLVRSRSARGDIAGALAAADAWLARDPLAESAHRERIRLHLLRGDGPAALEAYNRCAELLRDELGIDPSPETRELAARAGEAGPSPPTQPAPELPMLGRADEVAALAASFERTRRGGSELALIIGEAGIGKTRLLSEFVAWARAHSAEVVETAAFPSGRRLAYHAVERALGDVIGAHRSDGAELRLFQDAAARLGELARGRPLVVVIDDLHWMDADSMRLLAFAAGEQSAAERRVLWLVTVRDDELAARPGLAAWVEEAGRGRRFTEVRLGPLATEHSERMLDLWPGLPAAADREALRRCGGRPLLLVETLRFISAGGDPEVTAPVIRQAMRRRLRELSADARRLCTAAAVLERAAQLPLLRALAELDAKESGDALRELLQKRVLAGDAAYAFSHELLRESAYAEVGAEERRAWHRRAAELLGDSSAAERAHHFELAGELEAAFALRLEAAWDAMALPAYRAAEHQFRAAIAIDAGATEAWLGLARAEDLSGDREAARETCERLVARARERGQPAVEAAALTRLAELAGRDLAEQPPVELFEEAAAAADESGDEALLADAELGQAQVLAYHGQLSEAAERLAVARRRIAALDRPDLAARCLNLGAFINQGQGRWSEALRLAREAKVAYRELVQPLMVLDSTGYEGAALVFLGRWREALKLVRRALRDAERLGNPWAVGNMSLIEAWALHESGDVAAAAAAASRGAEACHTAGFAPLEVMNKALAGRCRRLAGELGQALAVHRGAHEIARSLDGVAMQIVTEELAADHAAAGDWEAAREWAAASIAARNEMWMFAYLCLPELAEIHLHHGLPFTIPPLPEGDRYRLIELRTRLVMEPSEELRVEALELAKRLELPLETSRLET